MDQSIMTIRFTWLLIMIVLASWAIPSSQVGMASPAGAVDRASEATKHTAPADTFQGAPVYDSGWYDLGTRPDPLSVEFIHDLGGDPDDYYVYLTCMDDLFNGTYNCTDTAFNVNAHWYGLTSTAVSVWAGSARPDAVRVQIYLITPTYDSGWDVLSARPDPISRLFTHNVGRDGYLHMVKLDCKDDSELGTYDCTDQSFNINAYWYALTGTTVSAWADNGPRPDEIRIRLFAINSEYDTGWDTIGARPDPLPLNYNHGLGGNPDDYFVHLQCRDDTSLGTYDCTSFLFNKQANWYGLTDSDIAVWVTGGTIPDEVRVRILVPKYVYLPMVMRYLCP